MRTVWLPVLLAFVTPGCESTSTINVTTPEPAAPLDEPVAIAMAIGGVT